jgi:predicted ester cyclase
VTEAVEAYRAAFPDLHFEATSVISEDDRVACHYTFTGTHMGEFMGLPATGRSVTVEGVDIGRMSADGRCAEHWGFVHEGDMMAQLGLVPGQAVGDIDIDITERTAAPA